MCEKGERVRGKSNNQCFDDRIRRALPIMFVCQHSLSHISYLMLYLVVLRVQVSVGRSQWQSRADLGYQFDSSGANNDNFRRSKMTINKC